MLSRTLHQWPELGQHVLGRLSQGGAAADQIIGPAAPRIKWRTRHGEYLASLFERKPGGDQRARARRRLDHQHPQRHSRNDAVAPRKVPRLRLAAERQFGDDRSVPAQSIVRLTVTRSR